MQSVYRGWVARPWCSLALHRRVGEERRLGGIWGYAAVCAITGQGGIIRGSYYGSQCMGVSAAFNKPSSWERRLRHEHWGKKAPRPCPGQRHGQGLFWDMIRTESGEKLSRTMSVHMKNVGVRDALPSTKQPARRR